jgi:hypothetical protein
VEDLYKLSDADKSEVLLLYLGCAPHSLRLDHGAFSGLRRLTRVSQRSERADYGHRSKEVPD